MFREHINTGVVKCCTFLMVHCKAKHKKLIWFTPPALNVIINFFLLEFIQQDRIAAFQMFAVMYIKYIQIFRRIEECYDQVICTHKCMHTMLTYNCEILYLIDNFLNEGERREGRGGRELFLSFKISMWYRFITCFCIFSPVRWFILKRDGCCVICLMVSWEGNRKSYSVLQYLTRHSPSGDIRFSVILYQYPWYFCLFKKILVIFVEKLV